MPTWLKHLWHKRPLVVLLVAALVVLAAIVVLVWPITDLIAAHDVGLITGPKRAAALQVAREAVRTQLLTLGAGVFAAGALIFTAGNFRLSRRTFELTEQGQVTDRYTKAIEQLGSGTVDVTIGGIYALERVARDSPRDHLTVMEVLAACIRENSRKDVPQPELDTDAPGQDRPARAVRADIQAALTVIGRRDTTHDSGPRINNLAGAYLARAHLVGADLTRADLTGADLTDADLTGADLTGAGLAGADLTRAHLRGARLTDAYLRGARLTDASYPQDATVPEGWVRDSASGRLKRANGDAITDDPGGDRPSEDSPA